MGSGGAVIFLLCLLINSGSSVAETPLESIQKKKIGSQGNGMPISYSVSTTQREATTGGVPIVNPTSPGTTPLGNPIETPPAPTEVNPMPTTPPATMNPPAIPSPTSSGGAWCIASPTASQTALQVALDYACGYGGSDCSAIQSGASCYNPNTVHDHASYAFNSYYQKNPIPTSCAFGGTAQLTYTDPSNGNCHYASPSMTTPTISSPANPMQTPPTPTLTTPTIPPGGPTVYGVPEPTGLPSSATPISCSSLLLFSAIGVSFLATKHL